MFTEILYQIYSIYLRTSLSVTVSKNGKVTPEPENGGMGEHGRNSDVNGQIMLAGVEKIHVQKKTLGRTGKVAEVVHVLVLSDTTFLGQLLLQTEF